VPFEDESAGAETPASGDESCVNDGAAREHENAAATASATSTKTIDAAMRDGGDGGDGQTNFITKA
jgi:hypothetical protein